MNRIIFALLLTIFLLFSLAALTYAQDVGLDWDVQFKPYSKADGTLVVDAVNDVNGKRFDIVSNSVQSSSVFYGLKNDTLYFRFTLADNPWNDLSGGFYNDFRAAVQIYKTSGELLGTIGVNGKDPSSFNDYVYISSGELADPEISIMYEYPFSSDNSQDAVRVTPTGVNGYYYLDIQVSIYDFMQITGTEIDEQKFHLVFGTSSHGSINLFSKDSILPQNHLFSTLAPIAFEFDQLFLTSKIKSVQSGSLPPHAGLPQIYTLEYSIQNTTSETITSIELDEMFDHDSTLISSQIPGVTMAGSTLVWRINSLQPNESKVITFDISFTPYSTTNGEPVDLQLSSYLTYDQGIVNSKTVHEQLPEIKDELYVHLTIDPSIYYLTLVDSRPILRGMTNAPNGTEATLYVSHTGLVRNTYKTVVNNGVFTFNFSMTGFSALSSSYLYTFKVDVLGATHSVESRTNTGDYIFRLTDNFGSTSDMYAKFNHTNFKLLGGTNAPPGSIVTVRLNEQYFDAEVVDIPHATLHQFVVDFGNSDLSLEEGLNLIEFSLEGSKANYLGELNILHLNYMVELDSTSPEITADKSIDYEMLLTDKPLFFGSTDAPNSSTVNLKLDINGDSVFDLNDLTLVGTVLNGKWYAQSTQSLPSGLMLNAIVSVADEIGNVGTYEFSFSISNNLLMLTVDNFDQVMHFFDFLQLSGSTNAPLGTNVQISILNNQTNEKYYYYVLTDADDFWELDLSSLPSSADRLKNGSYNFEVSITYDHVTVNQSGAFVIDKLVPEIESLQVVDWASNMPIYSLNGSILNEQLDEMVTLEISRVGDDSFQRIYQTLVDAYGDFTFEIVDDFVAGTYVVKVVVEDLAGNVSSVHQDSFVIDRAAPTVPSSLTSTNVKMNEFLLSWGASTDNLGVVGYEVYRNGNVIETVTTPHYTFTGLEPNTVYNITVLAFDALNNRSLLSSALLVKTVPDLVAPTVPSGLYASNITMSDFLLTWVDSTDNVGVVGYDVYRNGNYVSTVTTPSYIFQGLIANTTHSITIVAHDAAKNRSVSSIVFSVKMAPDTAPPSVPSGLVASNTTITGFRLTWTASTDNVGVTNYNVYRNGSYVATVSSTVYTLSGLTPNTSYNITVLALDAAKNRSALSNTLAVRTAADTVAPSVPSGLLASTISATEFLLTWTVSTDNVGVVGYDVYRNGSYVATVATPSYLVKGLAPNTTYSITIDALDAGKNRSALSAILNVKTVLDTVAPTVPSGLAATNITSTGFRLNWTASTDNVGVTGYNIYRNGSYVATVTTTSYSFSGLIANTMYNITILVYDAAKNRSALSNALAVKTAAASSVDTTVPAAPAGLVATNVTTTGFRLTWTASTDNVGVTGYNIYRNGSYLATVTTTSYLLSGLVENTTYNMTVLAYDAAKNRSALSIALPVRTAATNTVDTTAPTAPTGLVATNTTTTSIRLGWTSSTDNVGVAHYNIYRNGSYVTTVSGTTTSYNLTGLTAGTTYSITVRAIDAAKNFTNSTALSVTTLP